MCAIPTSDMPGHMQLHDRVYAALDRCQESQAVDFKESAEWESLKFRLIRTLMAMGNLRDGGVIIIGASERNDHWELNGISPENLSTYDIIDDITDTINKYASPPMQIDIVLVKYRNDKDFLALQVREFEYMPYVCKKKTPDGNSLLKPGEVYIRPAGKAQTKQVTSAEEMQDLLELAAEKQARKMITTARKIGFSPTDESISKFDAELDGL